MAKKQTEKVVDGGNIPQVDIIGEKINNGLKFLNRVEPEMLNNPDYTPEHIQKSLYPWVRNVRKEFDKETEVMQSSDKASVEYTEAARKREKLANSLVEAKRQIEKEKNSTVKLMKKLQNMSKGTEDKNLYTSMLVYGAQSDAVGFNEQGKLGYAGVYGKGKDDVSFFKLDDMGESPIITEPSGSKAYVWKMAEKTKKDSNTGKPFDYDWTYTRVHNNLTEGGTQNTIGVAFADLAGDNQSKSFAEMYDEGLKDKSYYTHPETGETMPLDSSWMKNPNNADILKKFLGKYITDIMKDVHGPTINEDTGQVKKTQSQLAQDLIKKYSK